MTMLFAVLGIIFDENKKADAITSSNITTQSTNLGEMLLNGYENDLTGKSRTIYCDRFGKCHTIIKHIQR